MIIMNNNIRQEICVHQYATRNFSRMSQHVYELGSPGKYCVLSILCPLPRVKGDTVTSTCGWNLGNRLISMPILAQVMFKVAQEHAGFTSKCSLCYNPEFWFAAEKEVIQGLGSSIFIAARTVNMSVRRYPCMTPFLLGRVSLL